MDDKRSPVVTYVLVFVALLVLLGLTVYAARHDLGRWNFLVATVIAAIKAILIVLFFMHIWHSKALTRMTAAAGLVWLGIMFAFTLSDYWTRNWIPGIYVPADAETGRVAE